MSQSSLLPEREAAARYGKTTRTIARWDATPGLNFPPPIFIRGRRYRDRSALDLWDLANSKAAAARARPRRKLDLHQAVDDLQAHAVASGLVAAIGQDAVQWIMSEAFRPHRRPGDGGEPP
jgi:hypothetical protein